MSFGRILPFATTSRQPETLAVQDPDAYGVGEIDQNIMLLNHNGSKVVYDRERKVSLLLSSFDREYRNWVWSDSRYPRLCSLDRQHLLDVKGKEKDVVLEDYSISGFDPDTAHRTIHWEILTGVTTQPIRYDSWTSSEWYGGGRYRDEIATALTRPVYRPLLASAVRSAFYSSKEEGKDGFGIVGWGEKIYLLRGTRGERGYEFAQEEEFVVPRGGLKADLPVGKISAVSGGGWHLESDYGEFHPSMLNGAVAFIQKQTPGAVPLFSPFEEK